MVTSTTEKGEYVFYFGKLTSDDLITKDGIRYLKTTQDSPTTTMTIQAKAISSIQSITVDDVKEGATKSAVAIELNITS
jgi:hypothetical protein